MPPRCRRWHGSSTFRKPRSSCRRHAANARVRIFTPDYEMPFAGHPTLGTAFVCRSMGKGGDALTLEMQAGIIPVRADGDRWTLQANAPTWREVIRLAVRARSCLAAG